MLVEFPVTCTYIPTCVGKSFQFIMSIFLENALKLCIFTQVLLPHSKLQVAFFKKSDSSKIEDGVEEAIICSTVSKFNQKM